MCPYTGINTVMTFGKKVVIYDAFQAPHEMRYDDDYFQRFTDENQRQQCNIRRAARQIEAYALCNEWDYFFTGTLDKTMFPDRKDLDLYRSTLMQLVRDLRKVYGALEVLLVQSFTRIKKAGTCMVLFVAFLSTL